MIAFAYGTRIYVLGANLISCDPSAKNTKNKRWWHIQIAPHSDAFNDAERIDEHPEIITTGLHAHVRLRSPQHFQIITENRLLIDYAICGWEIG